MFKHDQKGKCKSESGLFNRDKNEQKKKRERGRIAEKKIQAKFINNPELLAIEKKRNHQKYLN